MENRWFVLSSVLTSRVIYTINWFSISPALLLITDDFHLDALGKGVLEGSFLVGAGIFQIPAGIASASWGPKNTSQLGMLILSLSSIGEGLSTNFPTLLISRCLLGIGAALFFSPAIGVLTPLFKAEEQGLVLGLYNSCFSIGGGLGLFAWVIVVDALNWHGALALGGILGLIATGIGQVVIPKDKSTEKRSRPMGKVLANRNLWIIGVGVLGVWGGIFTASQQLEAYLRTSLSFQETTAGLLASLIMFASIFGGPIGGHLSDRLKRRKVFILVPGVLTSLGIALFGASSTNGLWIVIPTVGFLDAIVFSTMYASPRQYPEIGQEYAPLGISIINSIQILGSFGVTIGFNLAAAAFNPSFGWYFVGGLGCVLMLLILFLREPFQASLDSSIKPDRVRPGKPHAKADVDYSSRTTYREPDESLSQQL